MIFEKSRNIKYLENSSSASRVVYEDGRMDRHDEGNSRLSLYGKGAQILL